MTVRRKGNLGQSTQRFLVKTHGLSSSPTPIDLEIKWGVKAVLEFSQGKKPPTEGIILMLLF